MSAHRSRTAWALLSPGLSTTTRKIAAPVSGAITACGSGAVLLASVLTRPSSTSPCGAASIGTNLAARPARAGAGGAARLAGVPTWRRHQRDHGDWPLGGPDLHDHEIWSLACGDTVTCGVPGTFQRAGSLGWCGLVRLLGSGPMLAAME